MKKDNYDEAILRLKNITYLLYGGYYEPYSDRDWELGKKIDKLLAELEKEGK